MISRLSKSNKNKKITVVQMDQAAYPQNRGTFDFLKNIDIFGKPVPTFSIRGQTEVKTLCGALISLFIMFLTIMFGILKLQHLFERKNSTINTNISPLEAGVKYKLDQDEFMMAFTAENYDTGAPLSDPRYVKWVTAYWERVGGEWIINWFPMHKCSGAEMARFKNPENDLIATRVN